MLPELPILLWNQVVGLRADIGADVMFNRSEVWPSRMKQDDEDYERYQSVPSGQLYWRPANWKVRWEQLFEVASVC